MSVETRVSTGATQIHNFTKYVHAIGVSSLNEDTGINVRVSIYDGTGTDGTLMWQIACPAGDYRGQVFPVPLYAASGSIFVQTVDQATGSGVSTAARTSIQAH